MAKTKIEKKVQVVNKRGKVANVNSTNNANSYRVSTTVKVDNNFDPYEIIKSPLSTEKGIRQIEFWNKLMFAVHLRATKADVKRAVEELFKVKVTKVNIQNSISGQKKASVTLSKRNLASDVSADLGLI